MIHEEHFRKADETYSIRTNGINATHGYMKDGQWTIFPTAHEMFSYANGMNSERFTISDSEYSELCDLESYEYYEIKKYFEAKYCEYKEEKYYYGSGVSQDGTHYPITESDSFEECILGTIAEAVDPRANPDVKFEHYIAVSEYGNTKALSFTRQDVINGTQIMSIINGIDWDMLMRQKRSMLTVMDEREHSTIDPDPYVEDMQGIVNLIDYIQDFAVETMKLPEKLVFDNDDTNEK